MKTEKGDEAYLANEKTDSGGILQAIKKSTFSVLYVLLKEEDGGILRFFLENVIDYLQMFEFIFNEKVKHVWKADKVLQMIFDIFGFFAIAKYFSGSFTWTLYLIIFYFCIALIVLTVIDIIYVSYSFSKQRFTVLWPLILLREGVTLSVTVFFLPITEFLIKMVTCETDPNTQILVHSSFPEIQCWKGTHILHGIIGLTTTITFVVIAVVVALNYFESRISSQDPTARYISGIIRSNSRADVVFIFNKILLQTAFAFIPKEWDWPLIIMTFGSALWLWYLYQFDDPYYNELVSKMFKVLSGYYMWTCFMLFISKVLYDTAFKGGLISWLLGLPFIITIILSQSKGNTVSLAKNEVRFETPAELMDHLRLVLQLIEKQKIDKNSYLLLAGYIEKHKDICLEEDCPLKSSKKKRGSKNEVEMSFEVSLLKLIQVIDRLYSDGVKKFKKSVKLRIAYAFFLLDKMNNKKKALEELTIAESLNPMFDEEFLIYRYSKLITDQLGEKENDPEDQEIDVVGAIAFENHKKLCIEFIRNASQYHKKFWMELLEDIPSKKEPNGKTWKN